MTKEWITTGILIDADGRRYPDLTGVAVDGYVVPRDSSSQMLCAVNALDADIATLVAAPGITDHGPESTTNPTLLQKLADECVRMGVALLADPSLFDAGIV